MAYCIGIDLGGTNIVAGIVDKEQLCIVHSVKCKTNAKGRSWQAIAEDMIQCCRDAVEQYGISWEQIESVGIGSPGMIDTEKRIIVFAGNLPFDHTPLADYIQDALHRPVFLANDADAAAYGEYMAGAGKGSSSMVAVTLGTGVGSGIIFNGKIHTGYGYAGGEIGHTLYKAGGRPCTCGRHGCFEAYGSATGLKETTREHMEKNKDSLMWQLCEGDISNVSGRTAFDAMRAGDSEGKAVVDEYVLALCEGICSIVNTLQPELICIGGGVSKEGALLTDPINDFINQYAFSRFADKKTRVVTAKLGNDAGIIGAALLENNK
ncbi:MAG: ROK family protein [Oscillospiraceae bacterium]|nr:ROK family protein [Oscillospiraceae bacterium]